VLRITTDLSQLQRPQRRRLQQQLITSALDGQRACRQALI
jgi:hypothetical protein